MLLSLLFVLCAQEAPVADLRWDWTQQAGLRLGLTRTVSVEDLTGHDRARRHLLEEWTLRFFPNEVREDGSANVRVRFDSFKLHSSVVELAGSIDDPWGDFEFFSREEQEWPPLLAARFLPYAELQGESIFVEFDASGAAGAIEGLEPFLEKIENGWASEPHAAALAELPRALHFDERTVRSWLRMIEAPLPVVPREQREEGLPTHFRLDGLGAITTTSHYRLLEPREPPQGPDEGDPGFPYESMHWIEVAGRARDVTLPLLGLDEKDRERVRAVRARHEGQLLWRGEPAGLWARSDELRFELRISRRRSDEDGRGRGHDRKSVGAMLLVGRR